MDQYSLRYMDEGDLTKVLNWRNSKRVRTNMLHDHIITYEEHQAWFAGLNKSKNHYFVFEYNQLPIGVIHFNLEAPRDALGFDSLTSLENEELICYWGFYLGAVQAPKGSATKMGIYGLDYVFKHLGMRKVCAQVFAFNEKSIRFHDRLGFRKEAILKKHYCRNNRLEDMICYALFKDQWKKQKSVLEKKYS